MFLIRVQDIRSTINSFLDLLKQAEILAKSIANETLHFEWIDSDFVQAYTKGEWLLIEDVNVCRYVYFNKLLNCPLVLLFWID
jgi:midasin (ATPase involved in ribosome maturation)